ncbi:prolyl 4-hydroxylase subunit alpha-2-like isoform X2 [Actinia tenebrosa]|uniref:procollagen-proline 4-dioxygenase n=1 Tax=Actinia tenebrosa TaxID=6105 RepID=A0A6P8H8Z6_ACTTE|nr:prolyl 4-hydroxylase subunit alpha-2-like isoform X2 [Actinia tenebrosa]
MLPTITILLAKLDVWKRRFPDEYDLKGAITAIKRLQEVYSLEPADFSEGRFGSHHGSEYMLGPRDTFTIGRYSYIEDDFEATRQWMLETLRLMDLGIGNETAYPDRAEVLDHLAFAEYKTEDVESAMIHTLELIKINPTNERARNNVIHYGEVYESNKEHFEEIKRLRKRKRPNGKHGWMGRRLQQKSLQDVNWHIERDVYKRLCRGEKLPKSPQDHKRLNCWYFTADPLCTIKRCAVERVFTDPDILIFKDIMSDSEINEVRKISEPMLNRATVHNPLTGKLETAQYRISKNCWLTKKDGNVIQKIENRIAAMTRLDLQTAEGFQVQNYGLAGHYDPHFDFSRNLSNSSLGALGTGNRLATVLLYMTKVEAGGATVFPYIGARVLPQKGDAVFWHNLLRSGEGDFRTRHAGCPVLSGIKWVANKWIHEYGNEFTRPCSLRSDE